MKRRGNKGVMERSKSTSHITQGSLVTEVNSRSSQSMLGSRSLSHDSVFKADQCQSDPERPMAVSQENIHGKIKALQMKLQKQKMHLGPQPLMIPIKQTDDPGGRPEQHLENKSQASQSSSQADLTQPVTPTLPPLCASEVDFSMPAQFIRCLDNSAARHRMSIKPRNQRASTKNRRMPSSRGSRPRSESMTILEQPVTKNEEREMTRERSYSAKIIRPEESFTAPSNKSLLLASPRKSLVGPEEDSVSQHVGSVSPTISGQHHILKQHSPTAKSTERAEVVVGTQQALKSVEGMAAKQIKSVLPTSPVGSGDQRELPHGSKVKSIQGSAVSNVNSEHLSSVGSDQSQGKAEKESKTMTTHEKRNEFNDKLVQETMPKDHPKDPPQRHLALHRNAFPINDKVDSENVEQISTVPLPSEEGNRQMELPNQQRPVLISPRTSVSSAKLYEKQRMENITQSLEQAGLKREPSFPSSLNIKTQEQLRVTEKPTGKDLSQMRAASTPVPTMPTGPTLALSGGHEKGHNLANERQKTRVECEEEEEIKEKSKDLSRNDEMNTFGVKLRSSSLSLKFRADKAQSEGKIKQPNAEVHSPTTLANKGQNDSNVGPIRDNMALTGLKTPPMHNTQPLSSAQVTRSRPQSAGRVQERMFPFSQPDLGPSSPLLSSSIKAPKKEGATACSTENNALQTEAKEPKETSPELSWIEMAREKTRSLQQLFTSRLTDLAGLQTATRPAAFPQTQTSSPLVAGSVRPVHQISVEQSSARPLQAICSQPPTMQTSVRVTHQTVTQPPAVQSSTRPSQPTTGKSGSEDFYLKRTVPTTVQVQATQLGARPNQVTASSPTGSYLATKLAQSAGTCTSVNQFDTQTIHTTPLQHNLSSSPKNQPFQQSPSPMSQHRPQIGKGLASTSSGQDCSSIPQGRGLIEGRVQRAPEIRSKALPIEQRQTQKHDDKAENQISSPKFQALPQDVAEYRSMYSHSRLTESTATSDPMRVDREAKSQKKTVLPSSPPLQSMTDSGQPSWMELAKRKSMAWSDKTMD